MINFTRINESVADVMRGYTATPPEIMEEVEKKLGKPVDEKKWAKAKQEAERALGPLKQRSNRDKFYAYTMGIYKKMMGEAEAEDIMALKRQWRMKGREASYESDPKKKAALKAEYEALEKRIQKLEGVNEAEDEKSSRVEIPYKPGHYQFTFKTGKGKDAKSIRRIYKGDDMNALHDKAKAEALKDYPESHGHVMHSPQCDESIAAGEPEFIGEAEAPTVKGYKKPVPAFGKKPEKKPISSKQFDAARKGAKPAFESEDDAKEEVEKIKDEKAENIKDQPEGHDEEKEIEEDPTREKLETAKDEADERKGGPAELAADLRVSVRIEKMGIGRYKRMLAKHELSDADEKWLNQRIKDLEDCIKQMEAKIPELEKEAEEADKGKSTEEVREAMVAGIRQAIVELAKG